MQQSPLIPSLFLFPVVAFILFRSFNTIVQHYRAIIFRSHNEEIRTLKASNKQIKVQLRESNTKLKEREAELETLRDNYTKLKKLSTEKNLLDREKLQKKVDDLQEVIKEQEEKIQVSTFLYSNQKTLQTKAKQNNNNLLFFTLSFYH